MRSKGGTPNGVVQGAKKGLLLMDLTCRSGAVRSRLGDETGDQARDPPYYRVDFRVEKRWSVLDTGWLSLVVEMLNATLTKETIGGQQIGPVLVPSLGLEGGF